MPTTSEVLAGLAQTETTLLSGVELPMPGAPTADVPADPGEPVYDAAAAADIQGNVVPGFNKDHQEFLFLRFGSADGARRFVAWVAPRVATLAEVLAFRREFRAMRLRLGVREPDLNSTWTAVALSHPGIAALVGEAIADEFGDESFRQGLAARSTYLGDPSDPARPGHRVNWVVGGPGREADALVIVAADLPEDLDRAVAETLEAAREHGLELLLDQRGATLPGALQGHEHFGFKDGISQPGVRGGLSGRPEDRLTPRYLATDDPHAALFAKPGQPLVWPGQFLLGEPRQDPLDPLAPGAPSTAFPDWARRGSYLVVRRLGQDVTAFWDHVGAAAAQLGLTPVHLASLMVGRWPSGAPVMRAPTAEDAALAGDEFANNHFLFSDPTRASSLVPIPGYDGDGHAAGAGDVLGLVCPHAAHIRKVNPRDDATDFGAPADTLTRLMIRRGIPYGEPIAGVENPPPELAAAERGLLFVGFMGSIEDQFEFVSRRWANSAALPNVAGHDPIIGQSDRAGSRERRFDVSADGGPPRPVALTGEWVTPTGGGYFFAPPLSALTGVLSGGAP